MAVETKNEGLLVRIPENLLPQGFDSERDSFSVSFSGTDLLILKRRRKDERSAERQLVRLWGDLTNFAVPDVLALLLANHQSGVLSFDLPDEAHKTVFLQNGEVVFAQSSLKNDRLGECLVRMGKITDDDLDRASLEISAERKLGKILVDAGLISAKELFNGVRQQTLDILFSLFLYRDGNFNFFEKVSGKSDIVALNLDTRELLIEGMLRELGVHGQILEHVVPRLKSPAPGSSLTSDERRLYAAVTGGASLADLLGSMGPSDTSVLRRLYRFHRIGLLSLSRRSAGVGDSGTGVPDKLERIVADFNSVFMDVFAILRSKVKDIDVLSRVNTFFDDIPPEFVGVYAGAKFLPDGSLPTAIILGNLADLSRNEKVPLTLKALNELLYFILFEMKNYVSQGDAERLMDIVQNMELF